MVVEELTLLSCTAGVVEAFEIVLGGVGVVEALGVVGGAVGVVLELVEVVTLPRLTFVLQAGL